MVNGRFGEGVKRKPGNYKCLSSKFEGNPKNAKPKQIMPSLAEPQRTQRKAE